MQRLLNSYAWDTDGLRDDMAGSSVLVVVDPVDDEGGLVARSWARSRARAGARNDHRFGTGFAYYSVAHQAWLIGGGEYRLYAASSRDVRCTATIALESTEPRLGNAA